MVTVWYDQTVRDIESVGRGQCLTTCFASCRFPTYQRRRVWPPVFSSWLTGVGLVRSSQVSSLTTFAQMAEDLHLPDLSITGFRGLDRLRISRLGRATLIAGRNSVGKSTVLEAILLFASRCEISVLSGLLYEREEELSGTAFHDIRFWYPNWISLFHGRIPSESSCASFGPNDLRNQIQMRPTWQDPTPESHSAPRPEYRIPNTLLIQYKNTKRTVHFEDPIRLQSFTSPVYKNSTRQLGLFDRPDHVLQEIPFVRLGPGLVPNSTIDLLWREVALTDAEERSIDAVRLAVRQPIDRIGVVSNPSNRRTEVLVRLAGSEAPVPLKSLGDGALRLFTIALALANCRDGFLLIDEVENGVHHSVQRDFWNMVLKTARNNNVQVIATTHGWDSVVGFAQSTLQNEGAECALVRLQTTRNGQTVAVEYSEDEIRVAAEQGIEVR